MTSLHIASVRVSIVPILDYTRTMNDNNGLLTLSTEQRSDGRPIQLQLLQHNECQVSNLIKGRMRAKVGQMMIFVLPGNGKRLTIDYTPLPFM